MAEKTGITDRLARLLGRQAKPVPVPVKQAGPAGHAGYRTVTNREYRIVTTDPKDAYMRRRRSYKTSYF